MKRVYLSLIASVVLAALVACGSSTAQNPAAPTPPATTLTVSAVTITSGAATNGTFQLTASAQMSDGSTKDVTTSATWQSSDATLATVSATGLATVVGTGEVEFRATYQKLTGSLRVSVTKPGPAKFFVSGTVHEVFPNVRPVAGTRVEITAGADTGMTATSDDTGFFQFGRVTGGVIALIATKDGYLLWQVSTLTIDHDIPLEVMLYPTPPKNADGAAATGRCKDGTWSWAQTRADACTMNGGIAYGVCPGPLCDGR